MQNQFTNFMVYDKYARWNESESRREVFPEAVTRNLEWLIAPYKDDPKFADLCGTVLGPIKESMINFDVLGSMRALATAGPAADRDNTCIYNCAYHLFDSPWALAEEMFILSCGTGAGHSTEAASIGDGFNFKPYKVTDKTPDPIVVEDSKEGWALAYHEFFVNALNGILPVIDVSKVRPKGERLKTFGGYASGPEALVKAMDAARNMLTKASTEFNDGTRPACLKPIEIHDIACHNAEAIVSGGVRRSAKIGLSDLHDHDLKEAKTLANLQDNPQRYLCNNSAVYDAKPTREEFDAEMDFIYASKSGERGIFNREAVHAKLKKIGRKIVPFMGTNPCGEIILRPKQFCNLSEIVAKESDTFGDFMRKCHESSVIGTLQAARTHFPFLSPEWRNNCEEERLLGVSINNVWGHVVLRGHRGEDELIAWLASGRNQVHLTNRMVAGLIGINPAAASTCVKPSGSSSSTVKLPNNRSCTPGMNPALGKLCSRRAIVGIETPLFKFLMDRKFPMWPHSLDSSKYVVEFLQDYGDNYYMPGAIEHLNLYKLYNLYWADHNPSVTVYYRSKREFDEIREWLWLNWDSVIGVTVLPIDDNIYDPAITPYVVLTEDEYKSKLASYPSDVDWSELKNYESSDTTTGSQEFACVGGACSL